ncbi:PTS transporter subunit EIIC [Agathobaculum sp. NTUH-O15-33]|uniref:PTS transporter subunit EIIC n=1 Tax=Agathobaculum sp. NTUH-O15-33 TaxID=3079302 RepID=UPI003FA4A533
MKAALNSLKKKLAQLGRSMLVPVTAMPVAGILSRIASDDMLNIPLLKTAGDIVFGNMDILFALGAVVAFAKAKDKVSPMVASLLSILVLKATFASLDDTINMGIFAGIVVGCFTAWIFNHSKEWNTPKIFDFFTGEKFVITLAPIFTVALGYALSYIWPPIQLLLDGFAIGIARLGAIGVFIFGFLNRLLIPVGLHHVFNSYIYFNLGSYTQPDGTVVTGEMTRFLAGDPTAGLFLSMFFVVMMFGLPGAALAMYKCAKKRKSEVKGLMTSSAITSFVTGITEPLEFSFMFVAPQLYFVHALYTGLAGAVCYLLHIRLGFSSGGNIIDMTLNWGLGSNVILMIPVGIVFFLLYFFTFRFLINKYDLKTLGREDDFIDSQEITEEEKDRDPFQQELRLHGQEDRREPWRSGQYRKHRQVYDPPARRNSRRFSDESGQDQADGRQGRGHAIGYKHSDHHRLRGAQRHVRDRADHLNHRFPCCLGGIIV